MSWELWETYIKFELDMARLWNIATEIAMERAMLCLYYNKPYYLTVPKSFRIDVVKWIYQYLKDDTTPFPFTGDMGSEEYTFTIDFEKDVEIVPSRSIQEDMAAYNREANAEKGRRRVEKRFAELQGDKWTTAELQAQGFTKRNIKTFVENGLIKRLYQGHYARVSK